MRKIHLEFSDSSHYLKRFDSQKRFQILVALGSKTYYFSNKQKCERFINQFNKYVTDSYKFFLQIYADLNSSFSALFPFTGYHQTFKLKEIFKSILDVFDLAFTDNVSRNNTALINWFFWLETQLLNACNLLKSIARNSRNQTEQTRVSNLITSVKMYSDSFYINYKKFEYKGSVSSSECQIINLYNPLQLVINF